MFQTCFGLKLDALLWLILVQLLSYLLVELLEVLVSLLDLIHAALQVGVELDPLCLQPGHQLLGPTPTSCSQLFLSRDKNKCIRNVLFLQQVSQVSS